VLLEVSDLTIRYGSVVAARSVSLAIDHGEAVALLGPNGAGKTSLLRAVSGLVPHASGRIEFDSRPIGGKPAHVIARDGLVHVPEGRGILGSLTVRENLQLGGHRLGGVELAREIDRVLEIFPFLAERLDDHAGMLSGGQQQMLAIGRGLVARPRLLLIDEPSMGLAPVVVEDVIAAIRNVLDAGTAVLVAEENATLGLRVSTRAYVLARGTVQTTGESACLSDDVFDAYTSKTSPKSTGGPRSATRAPHQATSMSAENLGYEQP